MGCKRGHQAAVYQNVYKSVSRLTGKAFFLTRLLINMGSLWG